MQSPDLSALTNRQLVEIIFDGPVSSHGAADAMLRQRHAAGQCNVVREKAALHDERVAAAVARLLAQTEGAKAVQLRSTKDPRKFVIVSRDPMSPECWRGSEFDERGPIGHYLYDSMNEVLRVLAGEWVKGPPRASLGEYVFECAIGFLPPKPPSAEELSRTLEAKISRTHAPAIA